MSIVENQGERRADWREVVVVLLSVTTILTAWIGFQASKWGGSMSISSSPGVHRQDRGLERLKDADAPTSPFDMPEHSGRTSSCP